MGVSKNNGTPKWMVKIMENPIRIDDLGVFTPLFLEGHPYMLVNWGCTPWMLSPLTRCNRSSYEGLGFRLESSILYRNGKCHPGGHWHRILATPKVSIPILLLYNFVPSKTKGGTPPKTNMTMENQPWMKMYLLLEMVISHCHVSFQGRLTI